MAFCRHCGNQIDDNAVFCVHCGCAVSNIQSRDPQDKRSGGYAFLCFLIPILGLILYLVWKDEKPLRARSCGKGALISVCVRVGLAVLWIAAVIVLIGLGEYNGFQNPSEFFDDINSICMHLTAF